MPTNYAINRTFHLLIHNRKFYMPYFWLLFIVNVLITVVGQGDGPQGLAVFLFSIVAGVMQVALVWDLNHTLGLNNKRVPLMECLWQGLCFTPGFVLKWLKFAFLTVVGFFFFIVPGLYFLGRYYLDPYCSVMSVDDTSPYESSFDKKDFVEVYTFILVTILPGCLEAVFSMFPNVWVVMITAPVTTLIAIGLTTGEYFFVDYLLRVRRGC